MESLIEMHEEEVVAPEPYKFNPDPDAEQRGLDGDEEDDAGYTPGETEYADGQGTELNQEINETPEDEDDEQDEDARNSALGHS
jgi:hypothetical protein